jgi:hypothetical protein
VASHLVLPKPWRKQSFESQCILVRPIMNSVPESRRSPEGFYKWRNKTLVSLLQLSFHSTQDGEDSAIRMLHSCHVLCLLSRLHSYTAQTGFILVTHLLLQPPPLVLCSFIAAFISLSASGSVVFMFTTLPLSEIYCKATWKLVKDNSQMGFIVWSRILFPPTSSTCSFQSFSQKTEPATPLGRSDSRTQTHEAQHRHQFALQTPRCSPPFSCCSWPSLDVQGWQAPWPSEGFLFLSILWRRRV